VFTPKKQCMSSDKEMNFPTMADVVRREGVLKNNEPKKDWTLVQRKKNRNRFIGHTGKALTESGVKFKAANVKIPLFISNVSKDCSEQDVNDYINNKTGEVVTFEKLNVREDRAYNAFKVFVSKRNEQPIFGQ
jgi:hypothetical protein